MNLFGSGFAIATQTQDASGVAPTNATPVMFAVMQEIGIDFSADVKQLFGQEQFAVDVARGKIEISGKIKNAGIFALAWNSIFFGQTLQSGLAAMYADTVGVNIPATPGPYTITPVAPGSGSIVADQGVFFANGIPLVKVASAPATGQYSYAAGVWTFAAADQGRKVYVNYTYTTSTPATAQKQTVNSLLMGATPYFSLVHTVPYNGKSLTIQLPRCTTSKLSLGFKNEDFMIPELDFMALKDPVTGSVMTWSTSE